MASLEEADATLASSAPLLGVAEPALLLQLLALRALGRAVGDRDPFYPSGVRGGLLEIRLNRKLLRLDPESRARAIPGFISHELLGHGVYNLRVERAGVFAVLLLIAIVFDVFFFVVVVVVAFEESIVLLVLVVVH